MTARAATALGGGLIIALGLFYVATQASIDSDYAAFLPAGRSEAQRAFMTELREGVASRIVLVELTGATPEELAATSRKLAQALKASSHFRYVNNGDAALGQRELSLLERHRYVLSDGLDDPARFSRSGLRAALEERLEALAGSAGLLDKQFLAADPTGEVTRILARLTPPSAPRRLHGVWFDAAGAGALLLAETRASGADLTRQDQAMTALSEAFDAAKSAATATLGYSSPGAMAVASRTLIASDARRLSLLSLAFVLAILAWVYRSVPVVLLCLLPAAAGLLAGVVAVNLTFGSVHGITLAFGATLLGEAVDYPSYLLTQVRPDVPVAAVQERFGRMLRLAVLTTACGSLAFVFSGFPGLAQLGVLTAVGVLVAGAATWWVVPQWIPAHWVPATAHAGARRALPYAPPRWVRFAAVIGIGLMVVAATWHKPWWNDDVAAMNPLPASFKERDQRLRNALGAPDARFALVVSGATRDDVLRAAEALRVALQQWVAGHAIAGFELVSDYLPSAATQQRRRAALPPAETLRTDLEAALAGLPFRAGTFAPFLRAVADARQAPPLTADDYAGSALGLKIESLLRREGDRWQIVVPLAGVQDPATFSAVVSRDPLARARLIDMRGEATAMMAAYRQQAVVSSAAGVVLIFGLLWAGLGSAWRALLVLAPVALAVAAGAGVLVAIGQPLTIFHYVALLLTLGIGVNYALVMIWGAAAPHAAGTWRTLAVVSSTALCTFGLLATSPAPVLHAIGVTVCLGVVLSLAFGALLIGGSPAAAGRA